MGGNVPLGYVVKDRKLVVHEPDAAIVRSIFERFVRIGSATVLARELRARGRAAPSAASSSTRATSTSCSTTGPTSGSRCTRARPIPGEHAAIIDQDLWDKVHAILAENARTRSAQHPGADAGAAEGADLRADRRGDVADAHPEGQPALPLLRQPGRAEARAGCVPGRAGAGGGDRGGGHRPAARHLPAAGDHRRHVARGAGRAGRHHRGRGAGGAAAARSAVGRAVPGRAGADRAAAGRAGRRADRTASRSGCGRTGSPGWCARSPGPSRTGGPHDGYAQHGRGPAGIRRGSPLPHHPRRSAVAVPEPHRQGRARASPARPLRNPGARRDQRAAGCRARGRARPPLSLGAECAAAPRGWR